MYKRKYKVTKNDKIVEELMAIEPTETDEVIEEIAEEVDELPEENDENLTYEEVMAKNASILNQSVNSVNASLTKLFTGGEYIYGLVERLHSSKWNESTKDERREVFLELQGLVNYIYGEKLVNARIAFTENMVDEEYVHMDFGKTYIYDKIFESKNAGISLLCDYVRALAENLILSITDNIYDLDIEPSLLSPLALEYYENIQASYLKGSWTNLLEKGDKYYYNQPLVHDSIALSKKIMMEHIKYLYSKFGSIDSEMSTLINHYMNEVNSQKELKRKRKDAVMMARKRIKNARKELESCYNYLEQSSSVFSKLSDDEFFELFNVAYITMLNSNEDGKLTIRIDNILNELPKRVFKDFDLKGIELPKYKTKIDEENDCLQLYRVYNGETSGELITNSSDGLSIVLEDIIMLAQKHTLFKFSSEKEKEDYLTMREWVDLKNHDYSDPADAELVEDGLNIILRKTNELISDVNARIKVAISKSKYLPHGKSMIIHDNKDALYDYHEFKNLYTKDEITDSLMDYIRLDIEEMKKNKKKGQGGRK